MALDWQGISVGIGAVGAVVASIIGGIYTGRNSRKKDDDENRLKLLEAESARDRAEDAASTARVEAIAADAAAARKRARDLEDEYITRFAALRRSDQRGWDLARYHFGLVSFLSHLLNNMFVQITMKEEPDPERVVMTVRNAQKRMEGVKIPITLEEPLERNEA